VPVERPCLGCPARCRLLAQTALVAGDEVRAGTSSVCAGLSVGGGVAAVPPGTADVALGTADAAMGTADAAMGTIAGTPWDFEMDVDTLTSGIEADTAPASIGALARWPETARSAPPATVKTAAATGSSRNRRTGGISS